MRKLSLDRLRALPNAESKQMTLKHNFLCVLFSYRWHLKASKQSGTPTTFLTHSAYHQLCRQLTLSVIEYRNRNTDFQFAFVEWGMSEQQNKAPMGISATDSKLPLITLWQLPLQWSCAAGKDCSMSIRGKEGCWAWSGLVPTEVSINLTLEKKIPCSSAPKARATGNGGTCFSPGHDFFYPFGFPFCSFTCLKGVEYEL